MTSLLGLRVELTVDIEEYLPTTEASGVRIAIHPIYEQPFPDTAGYSAPTGSVSSFGIRMVQLPSVEYSCKISRLFRIAWTVCLLLMVTVLSMEKQRSTFTERQSTPLRYKSYL